MAKRGILISLMVVLGSSMLASFLPDNAKKGSPWEGQPQGWPPMRLFIGVGITFFFISAAGELKPELAAPFAALIGTTAMLVNGTPVLVYLTTEGALAPVEQPKKVKRGVKRARRNANAIG